MEVKKMTFKDKHLHRPRLISCQLPVNHHNYEIQAPEQPHEEVFVCVTLLTVNMWCRRLHGCTGEGKCLS